MVEGRPRRRFKPLSTGDMWSEGAEAWHSLFTFRVDALTADS